VMSVREASAEELTCGHPHNPHGHSCGECCGRDGCGHDGCGESCCANS
jgi:hypothetical protein